MKCSLRQKGFTLVEIIVTLVILAILAAILIPSMTGWIDNAQTKKCQIELAEIRHEYLAEAAYLAYRVEDAGPLFVSAVDTYGGSYAGSGNTFTCPCGNPGSVIFTPDKTAILSIGCSVHGAMTLSTADCLSALWSTAIYNNQSVADYFSTRTNKGQSIDSNGGNWAPGLRSELTELGIDTANDTWRIVRTANKGGFAIYWTSEDISDLTVGSTVTCSRVETDKDGKILDGTLQTGTIKIAEKKVENKTFKYLSDDTDTGNSGAFTPDT